jgi:hypothetical protein
MSGQCPGLNAVNAGWAPSLGGPPWGAAREGTLAPGATGREGTEGVTVRSVA